MCREHRGDIAAVNSHDSGIRICRADYGNTGHAVALVALLDASAQDPLGGGHRLSDFARSNLVQALADRPQAFSVLAFDGPDESTPVGLVNCIEGFSTFACQALVNIHDVVVLAAYRGRRIAQQMLVLVDCLARERGACKLTLEVLSGNTGAMHLYRRIGFANYQLDPASGHAQFMQKWLD